MERKHDQNMLGFSVKPWLWCWLTVAKSFAVTDVLILFNGFISERPI